MLPSSIRPQQAVIGVLRDQRCWHGRVVSVRGARVRIVGTAGLVRVVHARYVFPDWP